MKGNVFGVLAMLLLTATSPTRHFRHDMDVADLHGHDLPDRGGSRLPLAIANGDVFGHRQGVDLHR